MTSEDLVVQLKERRLEIDCVEMKLEQQGIPHPVIYRGSGYIRQLDDDTLSFKLYATEITKAQPFDTLREMVELRAGGLIPDNYYYTLRSVAIDGAKWIADRIRPQTDWLVPTHQAIVKGRIWRLSTSDGDELTSTRLRTHFFDDIDLPYNSSTKTETDGRIAYERSMANVSHDGVHFTIRKTDWGFLVDASSERALDPNLPIRIEEALRFLCAKPVTVRLIRWGDGTTQRTQIYSMGNEAGKVRLDPPISPSTAGYFEDSWRLFSNYFSYVTKETSQPHMSRCSYYLHNARQASAGSLDSLAVGVSIAVEGLANMIPMSKTRAEKAEIAKIIDSVLAYIATEASFVGFLKRLKGLLPMMFNVNVKERLTPLADSGHIDSRYLNAWSHLRNRYVHPKGSDLEKMSTGDFQELIDLIHQVEALMYQIVFYLISYSGRYTDYGSPNWPTRNYPDPAAAAPSQVDGAAAEGATTL